MSQVEILESQDGEYRVRVRSYDGATEVTLTLADADAASAGRLTDDGATATATLGYLLQHQDAADLPAVIDLGDVLAAYPDAVDEITALRG